MSGDFDTKMSTVVPAPPDRPSNRSRHRQVLTALRRITRAIDLHSRFLAQQYGLTGPQLVILQELSTQGEISVGGLAKAISLSQATVTGIVDRLEKRGLVERRRHEIDKRRVLVRTTGGCTQLLRQAPPLLQQAFLDQFDRLAEWEQLLIVSSLSRVVSMMEAGDIDASPILTSGAIDASAEGGEEG